MTAALLFAYLQEAFGGRMLRLRRAGAGELLGIKTLSGFRVFSLHGLGVVVLTGDGGKLAV